MESLTHQTSQDCSPRGARATDMVRRTLAACVLSCATLALALADADAPADTPDFERDIAPMVERCCLSCHSVGGAGAYRLTTAAEVKRVALTALQALESAAMPPWAPSDGVMRVPLLPTTAERAQFRAWVDAGAPVKDPAFALKNSSLPDASLIARSWRVAEGWTIGAEERRAMRSFQQPVGGSGDLFIGGWRVQCDSPGLLSTMLFTAGDAALAQTLDERDASIGFKFTGDLATTPSSALAGVGAEGSFKLPAGFAMRLRATEAFVVECHADGRGKNESAASSVHALRPIMTESAALRIVEPLIVSAQGAARSRNSDAHIEFESPPLAKALDLACITLRPGPDAVRVELLALQPNIDTPLTLIRVERYDIHIDHPYLVDPVLRLPIGTRLVLKVEALNAQLAIRATPQAVLLVADVLDDARATVAAVDASMLQCMPIITAELFRAVMKYEAQERTAQSVCAGFTWFEAIALANALSVRDGLAPAYTIEFAQHDGAQLVGAVVTQTNGNGWRLPTSIEWEQTYSQSNANSGDLWNWMFDTEGRSRVVRGGCWADAAGTQGVSARSAIEPATRNELFGARFVRNAGAAK